MSADSIELHVLYIPSAPTKLRQAFLGGKGQSAALEASLVGDCWRTCVAMLLGLDDPHDVPHFAWLRNVAEASEGPLPWWEWYLARDWMRTTHGVDLAYIDVDEARRIGVPYSMTVRSKRHLGSYHAVVVGADGAVIDPSGVGYCVEDQLESEDVIVVVRPYDPSPSEQRSRWLAVDGAAAAEAEGRAS